MRRLLAFLLCTVAACAWAQRVDTLDARDAMQASQAAVGRPVGPHTLLDREAQPVTLARYRGKPLLVSFIYTGCFQVCPTATRSLDEAVAALHSRFGTGAFAVASIGFNQPADSPAALKAFAAQQRIARPGWDFLSAPAAVVPGLTQDFGFRYAATPAGFDHVLQVSVVDAQGRIVRQVYGDKSATRELEEALAQLASGAPQSAPGALDALIEQVRILCTVYDPRTGTYRVDYTLALEVAGGVTFILFMALYMLNEWRARRRERRRGEHARA